jgi:hypothetical protein
VRVWYSELSIMLVLLFALVAFSVDRLPLLLLVVLLGGLCGLLLVTDSTMMVYCGLVFLWVLYQRKVRLGKAVGLALIWASIVGIVVSPWALRNWLVLDTPGIVKSNFALELFLGNNPYSSGGGVDSERHQAFNALNQEELSYYRELSEYAYYGYLGKEALEWMRTHPLRFVLLCAKRVWHFWGKFPSSGPGVWSSYSWFQLIWYVPTFLLASYGAWCGIRRRWNLAPVWLFLLVYPLPYYLTHVQLYRYRYPVEPFVVLLAALPLAVWLNRFWESLAPGKLGGPFPIERGLVVRWNERS